MVCLVNQLTVFYFYFYFVEANYYMNVFNLSFYYACKFGFMQKSSNNVIYGSLARYKFL